MGTRSVAEDRDVRVCVDCAGSGREREGGAFMLPEL